MTAHGAAQGLGASLAPGDPLPPISLPDPKGGGLSLNDQLVAGTTMVLWLAGRAPPAELVGRFAALRGDLATAGARLFATTHGTELPDIETLCDREDRVAKAVGLPGRGVVVIDPEFRLFAVFAEDEGAAAVVAECREISGRSFVSAVRGQAPVPLVHRVLDPELCGRLIDYWAAGEKGRDKVATAVEAASRGVASIKRRADVLVSDPGLLTELSRAVSRRIAPAIAKAFQRQVTRFEAFRVGCYDAEALGAFGAHRDNSTPYTAHRLFAMSLNLNSAYTGGEVRFPEFGRTLYRPDSGDAVVFSCALLHEVLPVLSGRRFGLFTFLYDEAGAAKEREMHARERAAGREPGA
jgi:predicted 2-oxoglutarate/Fe(II)-dependent dioxygenase YbiX